MHRVIPVLSLSCGDLVKTIKYRDENYLGDPINAIRILNEKEVDEIYIQDINASRNRTAPDFELIRDIASEAFMPVTYGGGIKSINDIERILKSGVEKVSLNTSALRNPELVEQASEMFGSQAIVMAVDVKQSLLRKLSVRNYKGRLTFADILQKYQDLGAGEFVVNSVDRDGTMNGVDSSLIEKCAEILDVPFTYVGGVGKISDILDVKSRGASATGVGSMFVYNGPNKAVLISYINVDDILHKTLESELNLE